MRRIPIFLAMFLVIPAARAESVNIAVAANFTTVAEDIVMLFAEETSHEAVLSFGSTGQLYAQISQGAPFGVFLAADTERPGKAIAEGLAVAGSAFTYAIGTLVLYSPKLELGDGYGVLEAATFDKIAIADPSAAPYGAAAVETMQTLGVHDRLREKLVTGVNISQALQFVESGNAELGFVAGSQVVGKDHQWVVPAQLHEPIEQGAVLLQAGQGNMAAVAFLAFLRSPQAVSVIEAAGYSVP